MIFSRLNCYTACNTRGYIGVTTSVRGVFLVKMNIKDLVEEVGYQPKRKAACHGGEYFSPCPFCKAGNDRFLIWPERKNKDGNCNGGRYSCRVCGCYGDAITFLRSYHGKGYKEACQQLRIEPQKRQKFNLEKHKPKPQIAEEPTDLWKEKALNFVEWSHKQLLKNDDALTLLRNRGFTQESILRFKLGFCPSDFFRDRESWGLHKQIKENGAEHKLWLPGGITIPCYESNEVVKVKIRRSAWFEGDKLPKYCEVSGSKKSSAIFGDTRLSCALVLESELDAMLVQQEADDLFFCVALGGSTKTIDLATDELLRKTKLVLFLPDFDEAGAAAWSQWKFRFPLSFRVLTPSEKSAGDFFAAGGDLREWLLDCIRRKIYSKS